LEVAAGGRAAFAGDEPIAVVAFRPRQGLRRALVGFVFGAG
jgi:hypothetical protein